MNQKRLKWIRHQEMERLEKAGLWRDCTCWACMSTNHYTFKRALWDRGLISCVRKKPGPAEWTCHHIADFVGVDAYEMNP